MTTDAQGAFPNATSDTLIARYRDIAAHLRGSARFDDLVRSFALSLHGTPMIKRESEIIDASNLIKAIVQMTAEGAALDEEGLSDIAGAVIADVMDLLARMPADGGRA
jgi:hypothetical protein